MSEDVQGIAATLKARLAAIEASAAAHEALRRAPLDADFSEQAAELETQDALAGIEAAELAEAAAIRAALGRIADGSYGQCVRCGGDIAPARLQALPTAVTCIGCA